MNNQKIRKKDNKALSSCYLGTQNMGDKATLMREGLFHMDNHLSSDKG